VTSRAHVEVPEDCPLSPREYQVLRHAALGMTNRKIGDKVGLSEDTIKTHLRRVLVKLSARDRTSAVATGYEEGWLGPSHIRAAVSEAKKQAGERR
jgi:DNA-binding NarL/FixJ family response regulator